MSRSLDETIKATGTRFRIFSQAHYLTGFEEPETVWISVPPDEVQAGPADDRLHVVDAVAKEPYRFPYLPPHTGDVHPPVEPGADGHFDHLDIDSREFRVAHMYAVVRRVLDIWEGYLGQPIDWHFRNDFDRIELVPLLAWNNAHSGYGFVETGYARNAWGGLNTARPYCLNFDVLAHEVGHLIAHAVIGIPSPGTHTSEYWAFHESAADLVALLASLHCDKVINLLLERTGGYLYCDHEVSRIGELSSSHQIRHAYNHETMSTVTDNPHELSLPLTGAVFDILVEVFEEELVRDGLVSDEVATMSRHDQANPTAQLSVAETFREAYQTHRRSFKAALLRARDYVGTLLATAWTSVHPDNLSYSATRQLILDADRALTSRDHRATIGAALQWRGIIETGHRIGSAQK